MAADAANVDVIIRTANTIVKVAIDFLKSIDNIFKLLLFSPKARDQAGCFAPELYIQ